MRVDCCCCLRLVPVALAESVSQRLGFPRVPRPLARPTLGNRVSTSCCISTGGDPKAGDPELGTLSPSPGDLWPPTIVNP